MQLEKSVWRIHIFFDKKIKCKRIRKNNQTGSNMSQHKSSILSITRVLLLLCLIWQPKTPRRKRRTVFFQSSSIDWQVSTEALHLLWLDDDCSISMDSLLRSPARECHELVVSHYPNPIRHSKCNLSIRTASTVLGTISRIIGLLKWHIPEALIICPKIEPASL